MIQGSAGEPIEQWMHDRYLRTEIKFESCELTFSREFVLASCSVVFDLIAVLRRRYGAGTRTLTARVWRDLGDRAAHTHDVAKKIELDLVIAGPTKERSIERPGIR